MQRNKKNTQIELEDSFDENASNLAVDTKGDQINSETAEINGPKGLEPTRYGDWEQRGRCTDF